MRIALIISACLWAASVSFAANIYVATDGNDATGSGSMGSPYATVQKGADEAQPGDTVYVRGGVYNEGVVLKTDGEKDNRIVFSAYPGETPILDGSIPLTGWTRCVSAADCADNPNWADIWYIPLPGDVDAAGVGIYESGKALKQAMFPNQPDSFYNDQAEYFKLIPTEGYTETTIVDPDVFTQADPNYWTGSKIWIWGGNNNVVEEVITDYTPAEHKVTFTKLPYTAGLIEDRYAIVNHIAALDTISEYVVDTSTARIYLWPRYTDNPNDGSVYRGMYGNGFKINDKDYVTIQGFGIRNYEDFSLTYTRDGAGINNYSTFKSIGLELRDNRITAIQGPGINLGGCKHCVIERNFIGSAHGKGIFNNVADSSIIRNNEVFQTSSTAIGFYRSDDCIVQGNYVHDCNGHHGNGLTFYLGCHNMLVFGNRVIRGNISLTIQQSEAIYIINNILYNPDSHKYAIALWGGAPNPEYPPDSTLDSIVVLNNMTYGSIVIDDDAPQAVVKNNIAGGMCAEDGWVVDHNIWFEPAWCQGANGTGSVTQEDETQLFEDYDNADFTTIATSPAVDAATDVSAYWPTGIFPDFNYSQDIRGVARPQQGGWDIGPYEYTTSSMTNDKLQMTNALPMPNPVTASALNALNNIAVFDMQGNEVTGRVTSGAGMILVRDADSNYRTLLIAE